MAATPSYPGIKLEDKELTVEAKKSVLATIAGCARLHMSSFFTIA